MVDSKIFSKNYMIANIKNNSKRLEFGMNIDLLMIWLHKLLNYKVAMCGHVKIMMVMYNLIQLHKVQIYFIVLGYGSLGLMTSVLFTPDGAVEA